MSYDEHPLWAAGCEFTSNRGPLTGPDEHYALVIITDTDAFAIITDDGEGFGDLLKLAWGDGVGA